MPGVLVRRARSSAYRQLAFQHPSETQRAVVDAFSRDGETRADVAALLESGRELAPELSTAPFDLVGIRCPVLLVWGAHDRDAAAQRRAAWRSDSLPTTQVELIEGCGPRPQLEATGRLLELLLPFRHVTRASSVARRERARGYALLAMRRTLVSLTLAFFLALVAPARRRQSRASPPASPPRAPTSPA